MNASAPVIAPFDPARYFDKAVADRYDQGIRLSCPAYDALHAMMVPLLQLLAPQARFLCAGSGTGAEIIALAGRFAQWHFTGVDVSADMIARCRERCTQAGIGERVLLHHGPMQDFRGAEPFDGAASIFVAHFLQDAAQRQAYFRAIAQQLKPGALFIVADLYGDKGTAPFVTLLQAWLLYYVSHGANEQKLTADLQHIFGNIAFTPESALIGELEAAGFCEVVRFFQSYLFGAWIARKKD